MMDLKLGGGIMSVVNGGQALVKPRLSVSEVTGLS